MCGLTTTPRPQPQLQESNLTSSPSFRATLGLLALFCSRAVGSLLCGRLPTFLVVFLAIHSTSACAVHVHTHCTGSHKVSLKVHSVTVHYITNLSGENRFLFSSMMIDTVLGSIGQGIFFQVVYLSRSVVCSAVLPITRNAHFAHITIGCCTVFAVQFKISPIQSLLYPWRNLKHKHGHARSVFVTADLFLPII